MSGFLGQALFGENLKVRIFWSPDFKQTTVLYADIHLFQHMIPSLLIEHLWLKKNIGDVLLVSEWRNHTRLHLDNQVKTCPNWFQITFLCK